MTTAPVDHFDRSKPFYPLVVLYVAQLAGFKEVALRGIRGISLKFDVVVDDPLEAGPDVEELVRKLQGPLQLRSEVAGRPITVPIEELGGEIVEQSHYLASWLGRASSNLIILAHEVTKDASYRDSGPLWEFLRHCRNAAAHGGNFNLRNGEPRRSAAWAKFTISRSLNGTPLMKDASGTGMLSPGDPIRLLWDIEQAYPSMKA